MSKSGKTEKAVAPAPDNIAGFEAALDELETLVSKMESGQLSLDESLQQFERGITLVRGCQESLRTAELKIKELSKPDGDAPEPASLGSDDDLIPF